MLLDCEYRVLEGVSLKDRLFEMNSYHMEVLQSLAVMRSRELLGSEELRTCRGWEIWMLEGSSTRVMRTREYQNNDNQEMICSYPGLRQQWQGIQT